MTVAQQGREKGEIEYAFDIAKNNAMEDIAGEQTREESEKRTAAQEEGTDIYTTHDPVAMRTTVLREEVSRERLSSVLDDEAIDALAGANDAQRAEMLDVMDEETRRLATDYLRQKTVMTQLRTHWMRLMLPNMNRRLSKSSKCLPKDKLSLFR